MKYMIRELEAFSVIGQKVELTDFQRQNIQISTQFLQVFNMRLKKIIYHNTGIGLNTPLWKELMESYFIFVLSPNEL